MKKKPSYLLLSIALLLGSAVKAQTYTPNVSKDSLAILNTRLDVLKANEKLQEMKIKEAEEEVDVEKLRIKLLEANGAAKQSAMESSQMGEKIKAGVVDAKAMEKLAKQVKNDTADANRALERFTKQVQRVEALRIEIRNEERKISYKKPNVIFDYN